jgi:hypothetical protein
MPCRPPDQVVGGNIAAIDAIGMPIKSSQFQPNKSLEVVSF